MADKVRPPRFCGPGGMAGGLERFSGQCWKRVALPPRDALRPGGTQSVPKVWRSVHKSLRSGCGRTPCRRPGLGANGEVRPSERADTRTRGWHEWRG
ncbi:MAG: hypothetical protein K6T68_15390, partial [Alicyclobacillus shizuokensis]|nr:hypothetical protein [Alicyclobacillus shizuokensis]